LKLITDSPLTPRARDAESKSLASIAEKDKELSSSDEEDEAEIEEVREPEPERDPTAVVEYLLKQLIEICLSGEKQSYAELKKTNDFIVFQQSLIDLSEIGFDKLTTPQQKLCFWINVFNLLMLFTTIKRAKSIESLPDRINALKKEVYNIGGLQFNLLDLQFALLRSSFDIPEHLTDKSYAESVQKFAKTDRRIEHVVTKDPRVLFSLCEGTQSSPLVHIYHADKVYEELDEAVRFFFQKNIEVVQDDKELVLPKILEWYCKDFGKNQEKMLKYLSNYFTSEQKYAVASFFQVRYQDYDWAVHYSFKQFVEEEEEEPEEEPEEEEEEDD